MSRPPPPCLHALPWTWTVLHPSCRPPGHALSTSMRRPILIRNPTRDYATPATIPMSVNGLTWEPIHTRLVNQLMEPMSNTSRTRSRHTPMSVLRASALLPPPRLHRLHRLHRVVRASPAVQRFPLNRTARTWSPQVTQRPERRRSVTANGLEGRTGEHGVRSLHL